MKKFFPCVFLMLIIAISAVFFTGCQENEINIYTIQPWYDEMTTFAPDHDPISLPKGINNDAELLPKVAESLASSVRGCVYKQEFQFKNDTLTSEVFSKMSSNQIILFQGHGSYVNGVGAVLWNKNWWDNQKENTDTEFKQMVDDGLIVNAEYNEAITAKYIEKYCGNLQNSIIYLGQCLSGKNSILANAFLNKGAAAVIGNTDAVQTRYGNVMQYEIIKNLGEFNPQTHKYYTINESISKAEKIYGEADDIKYPFANGSGVVVYGNGNYRIA